MTATRHPHSGRRKMKHLKVPPKKAKQKVRESTKLPPLLWHSNAPHCGTGYGQQTALMTPVLTESFDVGISAFYGHEGAPMRWRGLPVYPGLGQSHGNEAILDHARIHFESDDRRSGLVVTLMDVWVLDPAVWRQLNLVCWTPIDHDPLPPPIGDFLESTSAIPMAMSKFGERLLTDAGFDALYVPHAVDTTIYKPGDRREARELLGLPEDAFVVGMVAANKGNPSRKCFDQALRAFKALRGNRPDALLYLHTELTGKFTDGVNLPALIGAIGLDPESVLFCDQYRAVHYPHSPEAMASAYNAMNVLLMPSMGEGFGVPAIEAQACGVPVIASNFSAQPEVIGDGWLVEGERVYTPLKSWQFIPSTPDIHDALRQAYLRGQQVSDAAVRKAQEYSLDVVGKQMTEAMKEAGRRFADREAVTVSAR